MTDINPHEQNNNHHHIMLSLFGENQANKIINQNQISETMLGPNHQRQEYKQAPKSEPIHQNSFDQRNHDNINAHIFHQIPHYFPIAVNPQIQNPQSRCKIRHIDQMNKSVKQIMRCNKEYRGQLLSAYQNKSKIQLQNVILMKEKQNMEQEKQAIYAQLDQWKEKVIILENHIERLKENHKKNNDKLKQQIEELHIELNDLRNTQYDLQNKANQNRLFIQKLQSYQNKIKELQLQSQKTLSENLQISTNYSLLNERYTNLNNQKNNLLLLTINQKKIIQNLEDISKKSSHQNESLGKKIKTIQWKYENLCKQYQYERKRNQQLLEKLDRLQMDNQDLSKEIMSNQQQYNQLMQAYVNIKSENDGSKVLKFQHQALKEANKSYLEQISIKQNQIHEIKEVYAKLLQQLHRIGSQYRKTKDQYAFYKEVTAIEAQNCIKGFEAQINSLNDNHDSAVRALMSTIQQGQQENERLRTVLLKKQELISEKEKEISRYVEEITELQSNLEILRKENNQKSDCILEKQAKIVQLQANINKIQQFASSVQQMITQLKSQNAQIRKKQIIKMAQKDSLINCLHQDLTNTTSEKEKTLQKLSQLQKQKEQAQNRFTYLSDQFFSDINGFQDKVKSYQQTIKNLYQQLNKSADAIGQLQREIHNLSSAEKNLSQENQDLKYQIEFIKEQYSELQYNLKKVQSQREQYKYKMQMAQINQRYLTGEVKLLSEEINFRLKTKEHYESQISQLSELLSTARLDKQKLKIATESLQAMYKTIHNVQQIQKAMLLDPKISIARFSSHITSLHRQAFVREVQKIKTYFATVMHMGEEIKNNMELLKLNVNAIYKGFQITFSEKRPRSQSKI